MEQRLISELELTQEQRNQRSNLRNAYLIATRAEALQGMAQFAERNDWFSIACIVELMGER
jgi:hypothetical protein